MARTSLAARALLAAQLVASPTAVAACAAVVLSAIVACPVPADEAAPGDAWSDPANPVAVRWEGERLDLWSFRAPRKVDPPGLEDAAGAIGATGAIDAFIDESLARAGVDPLPPADKRTLVRRMTFDVTGLPPSPEEIEAFVADESPEAVPRLVNRLLASPAYGEHLALLWLDAVRYADTNGFERDELRPQAWRYRDWVIAALGADMPFDRFLALQLAGDEAAAMEGDSPADADAAGALVAVGYLRLGAWDSTAPIFQEEERHRAESLADVVSTTGAAMLGLTFSCCNCHDHKYDPLLQADFFRLRACFEGIERRDAEIDTAAEAAARRAHDEPIVAAIAATKEGRDAEAKRREEAVAAEGEESDAAKRLAESLAAADARIAELEATLGASTRADSIGETAEIPATHVLDQGSHRQPREEVLPGIPTALSSRPLALAAAANGSSGRRTALARWIVAPENPFTARVIVNRIWQRLFGKGLVATPDDLGFRGAPPTHPELLDWLAVDLRERGWSLEDLHRSILLSRAYARASGPGSDPADPGNALLGRQNPRRLGAEAIRDSLLAVAGLLKGDRGGPPRWPPVPEEILAANPAIIEFVKEGADGRPQGWYAESLPDSFVRSVYLVRKRSLPLPFLEPFDLPDRSAPCGRRDVTTVAPQALNLLNDDLVLHAARGLAERVRATAGNDPPGWPAAAVRLALGRGATAGEIEACGRLLAEATRLHREAPVDGDAAVAGNAAPPPDEAALVDLCRGLFNVNEFLFID